MFEFLFTGKGIVDVLEGLEIDESGDLITSGVGAGPLLAMLEDSFAKAVCHAYVENVRAVGEDVDPELVFASWHCGSPVDVSA